MKTVEQKKSLLVLNMSCKYDWDAGVTNRNYHVLQQLIRSNTFAKIISVDFYPFTFKKKVKMYLRYAFFKKNKHTVYRRWHTRIDQDEKNRNVFHVASLFQRSIDEVMEDFDVDQEQAVIWSYNPLAASMFERYQKAFCVFDAVDNWLNHPSYHGRGDELKKSYASIQKNADVIFTVSEGLLDLFDKASHVYFMPNAVDVDHFNTAVCTNHLSAIKNRGPVIGYHGVIQSRFNFSMVDYIAAARPEWNIVIIGSAWKETKGEMNHLLKRENVHHLPAVSYQELPAYISCFDVALIPHRIDNLTHSMNPLKIYEYLATGIPIVSTPVAGVDQFQQYISIAISPEEVVDAIEKILQSEHSALQEQRKGSMSYHTWQKRVTQMLEVVQKQVAEQYRYED